MGVDVATESSLEKFNASLTPDRAFSISGARTQHQGASSTLSDMAGWETRIGSADADILPELDRLQSRARNLEMNNGVAAGAPQTFVDHVIGPEFKLIAEHSSARLGSVKVAAAPNSSALSNSWAG